MYRLTITYTDGTGEFAFMGGKNPIAAMRDCAKYWGKGEIEKIQCGPHIYRPKKMQKES